MATKVMESKKTYDWDRNHPVEHRPFIKEIGGKIRFFWITTVVTSRLGEDKGRFIAGSIPDLIITDAAYNTPVWVNARDPKSWVQTVSEAMEPQWQSNAASVPSNEITSAPASVSEPSQK